MNKLEELCINNLAIESTRISKFDEAQNWKLESAKPIPSQISAWNDEVLHPENYLKPPKPTNFRKKILVHRPKERNSSLCNTEREPRTRAKSERNLSEEPKSPTKETFENMEPENKVPGITTPPPRSHNSPGLKPKEISQNPSLNYIKAPEYNSEPKNPNSLSKLLDFLGNNKNQVKLPKIKNEKLKAKNVLPPHDRSASKEFRIKIKKSDTKDIKVLGLRADFKRYNSAGRTQSRLSFQQALKDSRRGISIERSNTPEIRT